jgi:hypothetical protein
MFLWCKLRKNVHTNASKKQVGYVWDIWGIQLPEFAIHVFLQIAPPSIAGEPKRSQFVFF